MKTGADNHGVRIDTFGIAPTLRWGIGSADEFSLGYYELQNDNGINYYIPWLRSSSPGAFSATNPAVLVPVDPRSDYGAASDYNAGSASCGTLQHSHRFADGGRWHTVLRSGTFERDQRASAIRFCVRTANANLDCPAEPPTLATIGPATPLTRGTNNKVQDLTATYLQTDYSRTADGWGRRHQILAGVDVAREEFNNYALVLPSGLTLDRNTPRATLGNPDDGSRVDESLRQKVLNRNFAARALGVCGQDLVKPAPHWKLLGGLRWERFSGNYTSPATTAADGTATLQIERSRTDSLWSQRFGVLWPPDERSTYYASYGTSFNTSGELYNYDAPGAKAPPEESRNIEVGARLDRFEGWLSARGALFHSTKYNERNRDSPTGQPIENYLLSGQRHATGVEVDLAGRITRVWEAFVSYARIPSARIDEAAPNGAITGEQVGDRPSLTPRRSGSIFTTYRLTPALRLGAGLNARSSQTPNRNPAGIVAPGFATVDVLAEYAVNPAVAFKLNVVNIADRLVADSLYTAHYIPGQARTAYLSMAARF